MERALGIELRKLSNLTCRYFDQQTNKRAVDAVTGRARGLSARPGNSLWHHALHSLQGGGADGAKGLNRAAKRAGRPARAPSDANPQGGGS